MDPSKDIFKQNEDATSGEIDLNSIEAKLRLLESKRNNSKKEEIMTQNTNELFYNPETIEERTIEGDKRGKFTRKYETRSPILETDLNEMPQSNYHKSNSENNLANNENLKSDVHNVLALVEENMQKREPLLQELNHWVSENLSRADSIEYFDQSLNDINKNSEYPINKYIESNNQININSSNYQADYQSNNTNIPNSQNSNQSSNFVTKNSEDELYNMLSSDSDTVASHEESFEYELDKNEDFDQYNKERKSPNFFSKSNAFSDLYQLEAELYEAKEENMVLGQKYMDQLQENQVLNQEKNVLSEKNNSLTKRIELLEKVIEKKQHEIEKKDAANSKLINHLREKIYTFETENQISIQRFEAKIQSVTLEANSNNERLRTLEFTNKQYSEKNEILIQKVADLEKLNQEYINENNNLKEEKQIQSKKIQNLSEELEKIKIDNKELFKNLESSKSTNIEHETSIKSMQELINSLQEQIKLIPEVIPAKIIPQRTTSVQTTTKPLDKKKQAKKLLEALAINYIDTSRNACNTVKKSHDEFVFRLLHVVRNQIPDTMTQFLNYFGAKNHISDLIIDEWIEKMKQTYEKHISAVRLMSEKQNSLYNDVFNKKEMMSSKTEILETVNQILFEDNVFGFNIESENQLITKDMYHEQNLKLLSQQSEISNLIEENLMYKTHINVMEKTQGKLSNVAELEKQLKRSQIKNETLQEEYNEYFEKSSSLEMELEQLKSAIKRHNLIIITDEKLELFDNDETQPAEIRDSKIPDQSSNLQLENKDLSIENSSTLNNESKKIIPQRKSFSLKPIDSENVENIDPNLKNNSLSNLFEETKLLLNSFKTQITEIDSSTKFLISKVSEIEKKKSSSSTTQPPEWLLNFLDERSTELMRASERMIIKYYTVIESFEKKIDKYLELENKLKEKDVGDYKDYSELNYLKSTEESIQQKIDSMMVESCQKYPLRSVDPEYVQEEVNIFLATQPPVIQEVLPHVLSKFITLHKACTNYIDQLLDETGDIEGIEDVSTSISHSASMRSYKSYRSNLLSRRQSTGSFVEETGFGFDITENPELQKAMQIMDKAKELRTDKVASRFLYWIYRLKLQQLQVEIFSIESKTVSNENNTLLNNLNMHLKLQRRHCDRLHRRLQKIDRRILKNMNQALSSLMSYIQSEKIAQQQKAYSMSSAGRRQRIQSGGVPDSESLRSSWKYSHENPFKRLNSPTKKDGANKLALKSNSLQLKTKEPLEREKLIHLQKPPLVAIAKKNIESGPSLREERIQKGQYSIFRPSTDRPHQNQKQISLPKVQEDIPSHSTLNNKRSKQRPQLHTSGNAHDHSMIGSLNNEKRNYFNPSQVLGSKAIDNLFPNASQVGNRSLPNLRVL